MRKIWLEKGVLNFWLKKRTTAYFISILFLFFMLFYSYHFCIFSLFSQTILKQFFTYFKPIILKQKNSQKIVQRIYQNLVNQLKNSVKIALK